MNRYAVAVIYTIAADTPAEAFERLQVWMPAKLGSATLEFMTGPMLAGDGDDYDVPTIEQNGQPLAREAY